MPLCYRDNNTKINSLEINNSESFNNIKIKINNIMNELNKRKSKLFVYKLDFNKVFTNLITIQEFNKFFFETTKNNRVEFYKKELKSETNSKNIEKYNSFIIFYRKLLTCLFMNYEILFNDTDKLKLYIYIDLLRKNNIFRHTIINNYSINRKKSLINIISKKSTLKNKNIIYKNMLNHLFTGNTHNDININNKGIIINDKLIKSISGPVSFYYLKPINSSESKYFPLIVLFGDYHRSKDNICNNCKCENKKNCCYTISDKNFLSLLDSLVYDDKYPVDFYTETFLLGTSIGFKNGFMEDLTTGNMMTCYHKNLKHNKQKCPTKKIRWQAGDARQSAFKVILNENENIEGIITNETFHITLEKNNYYKKISKKTINSSYIEGQICSIIRRIYHILNLLVEEKLIKGDNHFINIIELNNYLKKSIFKNIDGFISFLKLLYDDKTKSYTNYYVFIKNFFEIMTKDNSLIYKQILKQDYKFFRNKDFWSNIYIHRLVSDIISSKTNYVINNDDDIFETLKNIINNNIINISLYINIIPLFKLFMLLNNFFEIIILDLYTLLRIFKQPENGYRSSLCFCYFGDRHILNIVKILTDSQLIGKYELIHSIERNLESVNRCLNIDFSLNLSEEVQIHNSKIF
jgi:hypothetical protein